MKKFTILLLIISTTFISFGTIAQQLGHVNTQDVLLSMPDTKQRQIRLEAKRGEYSSQLDKMYKEYEDKAKDIETNGNEMRQPIIEAKLTDLNNLQNNIRKFENKIQAELLKLEEELMIPILEKVRNAIKTVATQKGYEYIFDLSAGSVVHYPDSKDITPLVKSFLGIN